jgi:hypothetical protein
VTIQLYDSLRKAANTKAHEPFAMQ